VPHSPKVMYFVCACDWAIAHPRKSANRRVRRSTDNEHAHAIALLMQIKGRRIGRVTRRFFLSLLRLEAVSRAGRYARRAMRAVTAAWMHDGRQAGWRLIFQRL